MAPRERLLKLRKEYFQTVSTCVGIILAIHVLPKSTRPDDKLRLLLTVSYFGAALTLLYYSTLPRHRYMTALFEWMYDDGSPSVRRSWQTFLYSLSRAVNSLALILAVFIASIAFKVIASWMTAFSAFRVLYDPAWWVSLVALVLFPIAGGHLVSEAYASFRQLKRAAELEEYKPRSPKDLLKAEPKEAPAVAVVRESAFLAGGLEWDLADFYKNAVVFGQSGTGKTLCVLNALLDGILASTATASLRPSGLLLDPKGDYSRKIGVVMRKRGREQDLMILDPTGRMVLQGTAARAGFRWNPFDSDDDELELAGRFASVLESVGMKNAQDSFWIDSARKFIRHAIALLRLTNPHGEPPSFAQIGELASSNKRISERADLLPDDSRGDQCLNFFANEWADLAGETRSSIQAHITNMIDPFLMEPYRSVFSGRSTLRIADMVEGGKVFYVLMPIADKEVMSRMVCTFVKLEFYREVLKRPDKDRASFFLCDEFQSFYTATQGKGDSDFFERSRQSNHANIVATQNLPALLKQVKEKEPVMNLLGNCAVKVFLRNTDADTNEYASKLFGEKLVEMQSFGAGSGMGGKLGWLRPRGNSGGSNTTYDAEVRKEAFTRLGVPSRAEGIDYAETIVHLASRGRVSKERLKWKVHPLNED